MMKYPFLICGEKIFTANSEKVIDKFSGKEIAEVSLAEREHVSKAVACAVHAFKADGLTPYQRYTVLLRASELLQQRKEHFIETIVAESGFTRGDATAEVDRATQTLLLCGEEGKRLQGEVVPLESAPHVKNRIGFTIRVPVGVVCAITPFNSPLSTVAHKVAPALAAGNSVILKPAGTTPITAMLLCEALMDAGLPPTLISLIYGSGSRVGEWLLAEEQIRFFTFTGSTAVGRAIQSRAGLRRTQLELGSISSTIVCEDADTEWAAPRCVNASFRKAGQVCTSVQRLFVHEDIMESFVPQLVRLTEAARVGDPRDPATTVGPMIDIGQAKRAETWVNEAIAQGAELMTGGCREGSIFYPTILVKATFAMRVMCEEIFAPVISIVPFRDLHAAIEQVNETPYGLAAGIFTSNISRALEAARRLEMGTVHINETSSSRVDLMPYGGVKDSGFGQEGPKYAIREMTDERLITIASPSPEMN